MSRADSTRVVVQWPRSMGKSEALRITGAGEERLAQPARRRRFIFVERLSLAEASYIPPDFDPGPEYDTP